MFNSSVTLKRTCSISLGNFMLVFNFLTLMFISFLKSKKLRECLFFLQYFYMFFCLNIIMLAWDVETNPGPSVSPLSICQWNLNSVWVDDFSKISQVIAFLNFHKFDILCLTETFLDSSISNDDARLQIEGYDLFRSDHPSNSKRGGVCIYYKDHLSLIRRPELTTLDECLICEVRTDSKKVFLCHCYRSPSQDSEHFEFFKQKWEESILNINRFSPTVSVFLGDFNARNSDWWKDDTTNPQGIDLADLANQHNLSQIIDEPTHILPNSSSCIDLIFVSSKNFVSKSGVLPSLFPTCHHQVVYCKLNFQTSFPPPYKRKIWDFSRANTDEIRRAMNQLDWEREFAGLNLDERVLRLSDYILNIFSNLVPNKTITVRDKDALWMTPAIKDIIRKKSRLYKKYVKNGRGDTYYQALRDITYKCKFAIIEAKKLYFSRLAENLNDPNISSKKYWSILNKFLNKKKIPKIPPIRSNDSIVSDVSEKANIFNDFFANQCSLIDTQSNLPPDQLLTNHKLETVTLDEVKILAYIRALNVNKAHGWDEISIRMIKICDESLIKPLLNIFRYSLNFGKFPSSWKRGNIVPVHKKNEKNLVKNYRPVSLLPIFSKVFEKCIYDSLYHFFEANSLFTSSQSGFRKGDSCISQLLSITHEIFKSFDVNPSLDTRGVFLDISKAFDRVWHEGLIHKLKSYGISGSLLSLLRDFLSDRQQRVILNGQASVWKQILAGVPQGSILGPLLFLIFINDLPANLDSIVKIFADDTSLFSIVLDPLRTSNILNSDLQKINEWAYQWKMSFNPDPNKQAVELYFSKKKNHDNIPDISFNNTVITRCDSHKHLGLVLDPKLTFDVHIREKFLKANKGIGIIHRLRNYLPRKSLLTIYVAFVRPHLDYGDIVYDYPGNVSFTQKLESIQYNACLAITGCFRGTSREKLYAELGIETLADRRYIRRLCFFYKIVNNFTPQYLRNYITIQDNNNLRNRPPIKPIFARTERFRNSFFPYSISQWNILDNRIRSLPSISTFKRALLDFLRPKPPSDFKINNSKGLVLLTRLRVGFSHLREHKFRHGFSDTIDPFCSCRTNSIETTEHYLLHCSNFLNHRLILFINLQKFDIYPIPLDSRFLCNTLLYGNSNFSSETNFEILNTTIQFLLSSERFVEPLF